MTTIIQINNLNIESNSDGTGLHMKYQYGVRFPDGKTTWAVHLNSSTIQILGYYVEVGPTPTTSTAKSFAEGERLWQASLIGVPDASELHLVRVRRPIQVIVNPTEVWNA